MRVLLVSLFILSSSAFAGTPKGPDFRCSTEFPTTSFLVSTDNAKTTLKMINHLGGEYVPVHTGTILASDIPYLQEKAKLLKKLAGGFSVTFDAAKCTISGPELLACGSSDPTKINQIPVTSYAFTTRVIETKVYEYSFKTHQVTFSFVYNGTTYDVPMSYSPAECAFK